MKNKVLIPLIIIIFLFYRQNTAFSLEQGVNDCEQRLDYQIIKPVTSLPLTGNFKDALSFFGLFLVIIIALILLKKNKKVILNLFVVLFILSFVFQNQVYSLAQSLSGQMSIVFTGNLTPQRPSDINFGQATYSEDENFIEKADSFVLEVADERDTTENGWQLQARLEKSVNEPEESLKYVSLVLDSSDSTVSFTNQEGDESIFQSSTINDVEINSNKWTTVAQVNGNGIGGRGYYRFTWQPGYAFLRLAPAIPIGNHSVVAHWLIIESV